MTEEKTLEEQQYEKEFGYDPFADYKNIIAEARKRLEDLKIMITKAVDHAMDGLTKRSSRNKQYYIERIIEDLGFQVGEIKEDLRNKGYRIKDGRI